MIWMSATLLVAASRLIALLPHVLEVLAVDTLAVIRTQDACLVALKVPLQTEGPLTGAALVVLSTLIPTTVPACDFGSERIRVPF